MRAVITACAVMCMVLLGGIAIELYPIARLAYRVNDATTPIHLTPAESRAVDDAIRQRAVDDFTAWSNDFQPTKKTHPAPVQSPAKPPTPPNR